MVLGLFINFIITSQLKWKRRITSEDPFSQYLAFTWLDSLHLFPALYFCEFFEVKK